MAAIKTVADVMAAYPNAQIQLTGHSLGGGLAEVMAEFFNLPAYVFAPAPFGLAAQDMERELPSFTLTSTTLVFRYFNLYELYQNCKIARTKSTRRLPITRRLSEQALT